MRTLLLIALLFSPALVTAKALNVEFKFTPFTGDPKNDTVESVPGKARVILNNVPIAEQEVERREVPVMFEAREIAPAVWVPAQSLGPSVRKGKNTIRFEFEPEDPSVEYRAQLRWASVTDQVREQREPGQYKGTNQADEGVDEKTVTGRLSIEREFTADFAIDQPWHHLPPVTTLSDEDRQALAAKVLERVEWFKPDFAAIYKQLAATQGVEVAEIRKRKCLEAAHKAGVHVSAAPRGDLEFVTTGGPEVIVRAKRGELYPPDRTAFERIKGDEMQMCAGMALAVAYPQRLVAVRTPQGNWEVVY